MSISDRSRHNRVTLVCGLLTCAISMFVLLGWSFGWFAQLRLGLDQTATKVNAAVGMLLLGLGLVASGTSRARLAAGLGAVVATIGFVTLLQYLTGVDTGLDTVLSRGVEGSLAPGLGSPSRMEPQTALALILLGTGLALGRRWFRPVHVLATGAISIGYVSVLGYVYGVQRLHQVGDSSGISLDTSVALVLSGIGLLWVNPAVGLPRLVRGQGAVGQMVQIQLGFALVAPPVVGSLRLAGETNGWYGTTFGLALMTIAWTFGVLIVTWVAERLALPLERAAEYALADARASELRLSMEADASRHFGSSLELTEVLDRVTVRMTETLGDACEIRLIDEAEEWLVPASMHHVDPELRELMRSTIGSIRNRVGEGMSGRVVLSREPMLVPVLDQSTADSIPNAPSRETVRALGVRSLIMVPLVSHDHALGTLSVSRDKTESPYNERDVELVAAIANRAAQAISHAQAVAARTRSERTLAELGRRALAAKDAAVLVEDTVELISTTLSPRHTLLMLTADDGVLRVAAAFGPEGEPSPLPVGAEVSSPVPLGVLSGGEPAICDDMRHDRSKGMVEMGHLLATDSGAAVPVPGRLGPRGVLSVASSGVGRHTLQDLQFLEACSGLLATALDRLDTEDDLREVAEQRRSLLRRVNSAQEEERSRIADGVHDDQVQTMATLGIRLGMLRTSIAKSAPDLLPEIDRVRDAAGVATESLRNLMFDLQPPAPGVDLTTALQEAAAQIFEPSSATAWQLLAPEEVRLPWEQLLIAHRIAREALVNVLKHAKATMATVALDQDETGTEIVVSDDGVGMPPDLTRSPRGHRGLSSMQDRASAAGGRLRVESSPDGGTAVSLWLPREDRA